VIRLILFDAAGTLFHLPRGVGWHYREVARRHGAEIDEAALNGAFRAAWKATPRPVETRAPRRDDDRAWWRTMVFRVLDECGVGGQMDRASYFEELWSEFVTPGVWELYPETRDVLSALAGRFRLGVVSNFDSRLRRILPQLGIAEFFEELVISSDVGADKPSPHIFEEALRRFAVRPDEVMHVGDDPLADWSGARDAGLQVFELRRPANSLWDLTAPPGSGETP
jgi:putative hydrolase of the HAD superfamily